MSESQLRAATTDDHHAVVAIVEAEDLAYRGRTDFTLEILRDQILADSSVDPARDLVVIERRGSVIASGLFNGRTAFIGLRPEHEHPQLRAELISWAERRQDELGRSVDRAGCDAGYRMRRIDRDADADVLHELDERAFTEHGDHEPQSLEDDTRAHLTFSEFHPAWSLIVEPLRARRLARPSAGGLQTTLTGTSRSSPWILTAAAAESGAPCCQPRSRRSTPRDCPRLSSTSPLTMLTPSISTRASGCARRN